MQHEQKSLYKVKMADDTEVDIMVVEPVALAVEPNDENMNLGEDGRVFFVADDAVIMAFPASVAALAAHPERTISPLLNDMVKVPYTCTSLLSGWLSTDDQCTRRVQQCQEMPDQAFFSDPRTERMPIHEACLRNSCIHVIRALLTANEFSASRRDKHGNTPLHLLFISHSPMRRSPEEMDAIVEALLERNPDVVAEATNAEGNTPLHVACSAEPNYVSPAVLKRMLAANPACASVQNILGRMPLHVYCKQPSTRTSIEIAQILLEAHSGAGHRVDVAGRTPLHHAALQSNTELCYFLVQHAERAASIRSGPFQETPLHLLCQQKLQEQHVPALRALLEAAPETITLANSKMASPLHEVCKHKTPSLQVIRLLIEKDPGVTSMTDAEGYTALHYACEYQVDTPVVECLLTAHRGAASAVSRKQDTALHIACSANSSSETVKLLIEANPEALTIRNDYGFTPLHCCCRAYLPRAPIVQAIVEANPECVTMRTNGGETALHLACSSGAYVGVLRLLADSPSVKMVKLARDKAMANKIGNSPLHEACFRAGHDRIETLAKSNPEWIMSRNNAGFTPLQVLCKAGRLDERVVTTFARIRGPEVFSVVDETGHTPLHSASRHGTDIAAIQSLIRAYPEALHLKTVYGDTPLHLSIVRKANHQVVRLIAESESSMEKRGAPLLEQNGSGQTPIGLAIESFQSTCQGSSGCCVRSDPSHVDQARAFDVLAMLVRLIFYGITSEETNLVRACVSLHRRDVRLDPAFIRRAISLHPEELRAADEAGNLPLHIEAGIPVEKMTLLDSSITGCCGGKCHKRSGLLEVLLEAYPEALTVRNVNDEFPLGLMIRNGRTWSHAFALALRTFPPALHWYHGGVNENLLPLIIVNVSKHCGKDTLFQLLNTRPTIAARRPDNNGGS